MHRTTQAIHQSESCLHSAANMADTASAFSDIGKTFSVNTLNSLQKEVFEQVKQNKDIFISTKTGSGKSLCYQGITTLWQRNNVNKQFVLVISPLVAVMKEQVTFLRSKGISAAYIGEDTVSDQSIKDGNVAYIYGSPEAIVGDAKWREVWASSLFRERTGYIVVDEAHTVIQW